MRGAFFIWSWLSQKCCFGNEILFAWVYTVEVHMCAPGAVGRQHRERGCVAL